MDKASSRSVRPDAAATILALSAITKSLAAVRALRGSGMTVARGEIVGIIGENGAGKSTLMKILGGLIIPDSGTIKIEGGEERASLRVADSYAAGIAFVHKELDLFDNLDVAGNVLIGREPRRGGWLRLVDRNRQRVLVAPILQRLGANFGPDTAVSSLSLAQKQMVEIAKALPIDAKLVILDEPTSSLPLADADKLLDVIAALRHDGVSVVFISHHLHEVEQSVDRVVALRDGALAGVLARNELTHDRMVKLMVGRDLLVDRTDARPPGPVMLSLRDVETASHPGGGASLDLHAGEILGHPGLVGAGRTELARVIFGIDRRLRGTIEMNNTPLPIRGTPDAVRRGIYLVPEDRKAAGLVLDFSISDNISLPNLRAHAFGGAIVSGQREGRTAELQRAALRIKTASLATPARSLSGGNQQKVAIAKWLPMAPRVITLDEPTRGIDVGAKAEIYRLMRGLADAGVAILMISSDMEEVLGASDRIAVMHQGVISGILTRDQFSEEHILLLAVGKTLGEAAAA